MPVSTTHDITVSVETYFHGMNHQHAGGAYIFGYKVLIENRSDVTDAPDTGPAGARRAN